MFALYLKKSLSQQISTNKLNAHVSNQVTCGSKPLRTFRYLTLLPGAGFLTKIRESLYHYGNVESVQLQSTNSRPLAVATRESARLVNVKGLAAFPCLGVKCGSI